jgi:hypothetical protein
MSKGKEGSFSLSQCGDSPFPSTAFFRMSWDGFEKLLLEKGIFNKEELLEMVRVVNEEMKKKQKGI